jgi:hypothetical protein
MQMQIARQHIESHPGRRENTPHARVNVIAGWYKQAWHFLINDPDRIRSIGTRD